MKRVALLTAFVLVAMVAALAPPETPTQALLMTAEDHKEFYAAFKEGRNPVWTGR